jgi:hypothetical protein
MSDPTALRDLFQELERKCFSAAAALIKGGFSDPVAYLCAGGGAAILSGILITIGLTRLSADAMKPSITLQHYARLSMGTTFPLRRCTRGTTAALASSSKAVAMYFA